MRLSTFTVSLLTFGFTLISSAHACDICALYTSLESQKTAAGSLHVGAAQQFSYFSTIRQEGRFVENKNTEHMASSITQLYAIYDVTNQLSFQASLPYINRRYRQFEEGAVSRGTEAGIGDMSVLVRYQPLNIVKSNYTFAMQVYAGLELPTGDSDRLAEEGEEDHGQEEVEHHSRITPYHAGHHHEEEVSSIHGHDLALGSGSYDFPLGVSSMLATGRFNLISEFKYTFRNEGDHQYEYADDFGWSVSPGYYLLLDHAHCLVVKMNLSGEYKEKDRSGGAKENDTAMRNLIIGPGISYLKDENLGVELAYDLPLDIDNSGTQMTMDYRVRMAVNYRF